MSQINPMQTDPSFAVYKKIEQALGIRDFSSRIIHYTSLSSFESVLRSRELWFGCLSDMNDTSEVEHYIDGLRDALPKLLGVSAAVASGLVAKFKPLMRENTFASSWCEYFDDQPDGRLSMWRTYASAPEGVGVVVDSSQFVPSALTPKALGFHIHASAIRYVSSAEAASLASDMIGKAAKVAPISGANIQLLASLILALGPSVKHEGFVEEQEMRFLFNGGMYKIFAMLAPGIVPVPHPKFVRDRGGKTRLALELRNYPEFGLDLRLERVLRRIVVSPGADLSSRLLKVRQLLDEHGLVNVEAAPSRIPLR